MFILTQHVFKIEKKICLQMFLSVLHIDAGNNWKHCSIRPGVVRLTAEGAEVGEKASEVCLQKKQLKS